MLLDINTTIASLLHGPGRIPADEVDVRFERPTRQWVEALARPTLSVFLFDLAENTDLRQTNMPVTRGQNGATFRKPPRRFDLWYLVSAITSDDEDEHLLIWRALATLLRYQQLPPQALAGAIDTVLRRETGAGMGAVFAELAARPDLTTAMLAERLAGLDAAPGLKARLQALIADPPISTRIEKGSEGTRPLDLWGALDLPPRPALIYVVTAPVDLDITIEAPLVLTREVRLHNSRDGVAAATLLRVGGTVLDREQRPVADATVQIKGRGMEPAVTDAEGRYALTPLAPGEITLVVTRPGAGEREYPITIPSDSYDVTVD
jgi:hypothetical protein